MESAREIWLAGLGAFNIAQQEGSRILEEGSKIFDKLVAEGSRMEARTRKDVEGAMHKRKKGTLKSGSGKKVTSKKQAIAIGLSEARKKGKKVTKKKAS